MTDEDERNSNVPRGTFGGSPPLSPSPQTRQSAAEAGPKDEDGRYHSTLVGHPSVPPSAPAPPPGSFPAPPKWKGAKAALEEVRRSGPPPVAPGVPPAPFPLAVDAEPPLSSRAPRMDVAPPTASEAPEIDAPAATGGGIGDLIREELNGPGDAPSEAAAPEEDVDLGALFDDPPSTASDSRALDLPVSDPSTEPAQPEGKRESTPSGRPIPIPATAMSEPPPEPASDELAPLQAVLEPSVRPLEPAAAPDSGPERDSRPVAGLLFLLVMGVVGAGGWYLTGGSYPGPRPMPQAPKPTIPAPEQPVPPPSAEDSEAEAVGSGEADEALGAEGSHARQPEPTPGSASPRSRPPQAAERRAVSESVVENDAPADSEQPAEAHAEGDHEPTAEGDETPGTEPAQEQLPDTPARDDVLAAMNPMRPTLVACTKGKQGVAEIDLTVSGSGNVTHAVVGGDFAGTPEGSCMARAIREVRFSPFKQEKFRLIFPFSL